MNTNIVEENGYFGVLYFDKILNKLRMKKFHYTNKPFSRAIQNQAAVDFFETTTGVNVDTQVFWEKTYLRGKNYDKYAVRFYYGKNKKSFKETEFGDSWCGEAYKWIRSQCGSNYTVLAAE